MSKEEKSPLKELIDLDELQAIQDSFAKTVGISSVIFSPEGEPLTRFRYPTGFCSLIQSTEEGKRRCFQSVKEMSRKAIKLKKPAILYCFAHGGHFVAPIIINDEHKGTMFAGQFIPQSFSPKQLKALEKTAVEINLDPQLLTKEAKEMCVIEEDVVEYYSSLLFQIVEFIGRLGAKAAELNRARDALQKARDALETRVQERTAELVKSNKQLKREITERKQAEEKLRLFSHSVESSADGIAMGNFENKITYVNEAFTTMFGYSREEVISKDIPFIYAENQKSKLEEALKVTMEGGWEGELVGKRKNGELFPIAISSSIIMDDEGRVIAHMANHRDITERKKMEDKLQRSEALYRTIFEATSAPMVILDEDGTFYRVNAEGARISGFTKEELEGKKRWTEFIAKKEDLEMMKEIHRLRRTDSDKVPRNYEFLLKDRFGNLRNIYVTTAVIPGTKRSVVSFVDLTERKRAEEERERLLKELEAKNTELDRFTYTVSHDLRSPLVTVQGFVEMLREDLERNEKEKMKGDLKYIENGTAKMEHLLNDTLQLSRISRMVNPPEDVPFGKIVQEALEQTAQQIKSSGVEITVAEDFPTVHVDRMRIAEVLVNLITNSINSMGEQPRPKIEIGYRVDNEETVFFVRDNGIGIDESQHEKVFELFYQVEKSSKGTGAGLAIVKRIIEVHNGRIWIESEKGKGCTVYFTLPVV